MSGAYAVPSGSLRPRRACANAPQMPDGISLHADQSLLATLLTRHRKMKGGVKFGQLDLPEKKQFYDEAAEQVLKCPTGNLSAIEAGDRVALMYGISIARADRSKISATVNNRLKSAKALKAVTEGFPQPTAKHVPAATTHEARGEKRRRAANSRSRDVDDNDKLPSSKLQRPFKGAPSHLEYQQIMKEEATAAALRMIANPHSDISPTGVSLNEAAKGMTQAVEARRVTVCLSTCKTQIKKALGNNGKGVSPQKPGGVALPSSIEKKIAKVVRDLRQRKFPVFPEEIMRWAGEMIDGTEYASYFPDGMPTVGWYRGWLKRMEFTTGKLRPLEQTRAEWHTEENLAAYFDVARDVLLNAGVAELNPEYDPDVPYSEEIIITHPERICSYDETKMELDCTRGGSGKRDRFVRAGLEDDGESIVTKSSSCASAACGRLGDGRALPVYIVFASGETYDAKWAPEIVSEDIFDKDGKPLAWRYTCNPKGSVNEEFCADYVEQVLHPALGYPPHRDTRPKQQGVIVCDGVGTHLCFTVIEKAIELGMEILLRVPNLSFVLQGEDTVNFKEVKAEGRIQKIRMFSELNKDRLVHLHGLKALTWEHFMICFLPAWRVGFTKDRNEKGWRIEGLIPFNRNALWRKRGAAPPESISPSWRASTANSLVSSGTAAGLQASGSGAATTSGPSPESAPETGALPPGAALGLVPERVKEAMDYMDKSKVFQGQISFDQVVAQNLRLMEAGKIVNEWVAAGAQNPKPEKTRITAKTMFGLKGSATGEEGRKMAKERNEQNQTEKMSKAEKEVAKQKKAVEVAALVTKGAGLLLSLEQNGPSHISSLTVADILALLTNADPQGTISKPKNKAEGLERVRALGSIQAALRRHVADATAAAAAAAVAAPPPPPRFPDSEAHVEGNRPSIGSVGSSGASGQPVAPVGPAVL